jgi:hypothetical protein
VDLKAVVLIALFVKEVSNRKWKTITNAKGDHTL